jgi:hypothetical protein
LSNLDWLRWCDAKSFEELLEVHHFSGCFIESRGQGLAFDVVSEFLNVGLDVRLMCRCPVLDVLRCALMWGHGVVRLMCAPGYFQEVG